MKNTPLGRVINLPFPMSNVHLIDHPLVQHKLTLMRRKDASTNSFRRMLGELSTLMAYEVLIST